MNGLGTPLKSRPCKLCVTHHYACDCREEVFAEYVDAIAKLEMRVNAAEKLLKGFTASDLCGANTWAYDACDELLSEFWAND